MTENGSSTTTPIQLLGVTVGRATGEVELKPDLVIEILNHVARVGPEWLGGREA